MDITQDTKDNAKDNRSRILVVDDDTRLRTLLAKYLEEDGFWCALRTMASRWINLWSVKHFHCLCWI